MVVSCGAHPDQDLSVSKSEQFDLRPDGGCQIICDYRLDCGHTCVLKCHPFDRQHKDYKCVKYCDKLISKCGHQCKLTCSHEGECKTCGMQVDKQISECGHKIRIRCDREPKRTDCRGRCNHVFPCGHTCTKDCGVLDCGSCMTLIEIPLACRHGGTNLVKCSVSEEEKWRAMYMCKKPCNADLDCGHKCMEQCCDCYGGYIHGECRQKCKRVFFCGHKCQVI